MTSSSPRPSTPACPPKREARRRDDRRWTMADRRSPINRSSCLSLVLVAFVLVLFVVTPSFAQSGPWENAVTVLRTSFTTTIAKALSLIAIVVGGLAFAFGEGGSKRLMAGIIFGVGMAVTAVNFMSWLFGV